MQSALDLDGRADGFCEFLGALTIKSSLLERDIQCLRAAFYREGAVDRRRAVEIFHANRIMRARHDGWTEFYLEALSDFFLTHQENFIVLSPDSETTFLAWLGQDPMIDDLGERRLATRIFLRANGVSERFERRLFDAVKGNLLHQSERWLGGARSAGVIDAMDIQLVRRLIHGDGDHLERRISRVGADFLLQLDRNAKHVTDPESWRDLLIDSVARYLSDGGGVQSVTDDGIEVRLAALLDGRYPRERALHLRNDVLVAAARIRPYAARDLGDQSRGSL